MSTKRSAYEAWKARAARLHTELPRARVGHVGEAGTLRRLDHGLVVAVKPTSRDDAPGDDLACRFTREGVDGRK